MARFLSATAGAFLSCCMLWSCSLNPQPEPPADPNSLGNAGSSTGGFPGSGKQDSHDAAANCPTCPSGGHGGNSVGLDSGLGGTGGLGLTGTAGAGGTGWAGSSSGSAGSSAFDADAQADDDASMNDASFDAVQEPAGDEDAHSDAGQDAQSILDSDDLQ